MTRNKCEKCGNLFIRPAGPQEARLLLIGEFPSYDSIRNGYIGDSKIDSILQHELARIGIQLSSCRHINLWWHARNKECDPAYHLDLTVREIPNHEWVILMGSEITKAITGKGIMEVCGLQVKSKLFPKVKFFAIPNPGTLLRGDIGEMRLALDKFKLKLRGKHG